MGEGGHGGGDVYVEQMHVQGFPLVFVGNDFEDEEVEVFLLGKRRMVSCSGFPLFQDDLDLIQPDLDLELELMKSSDKAVV